MKRILTLLPLCLLFIGCGGGGGSSSSAPPIANFPGIATNGGQILAGIGDISVRVVDRSTGAAIEGATVWVNNNINNTALTDATGQATVGNIQGSQAARSISAGKAGFGLITIVTTATELSLSLRKSSAAGNDTVNVQGTALFSGVTPNADALFFTETAEKVGYTSTSVQNAGGAGNFSISVPANQPHLFGIIARDGNNTISAITVATVNAGTSNIALGAVQLALEDASLPLTTGQVQGISANHDQSTVRIGFFTDNFNLVHSIGASNPAGGLAVYNNFRVPGPNVTGLLQTINFQNRLFAETRDTTTSQFSEVFGNYDLLDTQFPIVTMPAGDLNVVIAPNGSTPTLTMTVTNATLSASSAYYEMNFLNIVNGNRKRQWSIFLAGDSQNFVVPTVPVALMDEGLVAGQSYTVTTRVRGTSGIDFANFNILQALNASGQLSFGQDVMYTP
ncbi:MAG: hypothetical protein P1V97_12225 [Planctomycetota bacterium]|nr:hypothetical protein [Planctomycetota bacterium]